MKTPGAAHPIDPETRIAFRDRVLGYYREHGRHELPWRVTDDPYRILVAEVMLQQTQVPRVLPKYGSFLDAFPSLGALAAAPLEAVLREWQGLGYNRRAANLKRAAETVVAESGGELPRTADELRRLPGIGPATAAQIAAFAFGTPSVLIETNIRAVYLHEFFQDSDDVPDSGLMPLIEATLDRDDPRTWYYALMDYGAWLKRTLPNPSRRSRHHTRQSRFEGSDRQLRGRLLRALLAEPDLTAEDLAERTAEDPSRVERLLEALASDGLVTATDGTRYSIA